MSDNQTLSESPEPVLEGREVTKEEASEFLIEKSEAKANDSFATASTLHGMYMPRFKAGIHQLSSRQLRRIIIALMEVPFWDKEPNFRNSFEKEMFAIGDNLLIAKTIMISQSYMEAAESAAAAKEQKQEENENE